MKNYLFAPLLFLLNFGYSQTHEIIIGKIDSLHSVILGEERKIWVYVPNSDPNSVFSPQHYPVVYLLDGDAHFYSVMGMIQQLSEVNGNTVCPEMIVVGIPNTDRTRDLTPTHAASSPFGGGNPFPTSGGGENFTRFLEKELIPHIDSVYPTMPYRMLIGHSFGGLLVINTLINHPNLFNSYLAIDPSLWWDNQKLLKEAGSVLGQKDFTGKGLFLGIANTMTTGMDTSMVKKDTSSNTIHIRSILEFAGLLNKNTTHGLRWSYRYYDQDDHGSVPLIAEYDALRFLFKGYKLPSFGNLTDDSFKADSAIRVHFRDVSAQMGYQVLPPEALVNQLGYFYMQNKKFDKAYALFHMNIENYPKSFNVYDSMGDLYDARGDKQKAIELYTKALTLRDFPDTKQKLEKLKNSK